VYDYVCECGQCFEAGESCLRGWIEQWESDGLIGLSSARVCKIG
jgi:hypothetical protein